MRKVESKLAHDIEGVHELPVLGELSSLDELLQGPGCRRVHDDAEPDHFAQGNLHLSRAAAIALGPRHGDKTLTITLGLGKMLGSSQPPLFLALLALRVPHM